MIKKGTIVVAASDDAVHANYGDALENGSTGQGNITISGGALSIASGDDGLHAETIGEMNGGSYTILKSYEGYEAAKVQISGGTLSITSADDGINAADGTETRMGVGNTNCYMS